MIEQDAALNLLILTGSDEVTFGQMRLELLGSNVLNKAKDEAKFVPPELPRHRAGGKEGPYCTFITGDYQSGKSHLARKQPGIVALPHTGDALDLSMTIAFFKKAAQEKAPPKAVWIDINSYMISPTPKDPHKLQTLNYILWMLINHRLVIDEATGSTVLIPKDTHLYIEVPKNMMFCSSVPASMTSDPTMSISSCAHLGIFVETSSALKDFDISDKHAKVAAGLSLLVSQDARMVCRLGQNWDWGRVSQFGVGGANVSERDNRVREVLTQCFECNLLPKATLVTSGTTATDIVIANNGRFASLLQLLYSRFQPLLSAFGAGDWIVNYMTGFLKAMKKIVEQTVARWSEDCIITHTNLVRQPIFLPTADSFITYPQSMKQDDQDLLKLCKGSFDGRESMVKELKAESDAQVRRAKVEQAQGKGDEKVIMAANSLSYLDSNDVDLSYVLTGVGNMPDMKDLQQAFDAVGFVTVDDILIRALHCVERQQSRVSLIIEGGTGVGKSFLLSMMFRIQIQYVVRRAITLVRDFLWCEVVEFERKKDQKALHQSMVVFGLDPNQEFPKLSWFTHTEKGEQLIANMYGPNVLKHIAPIFEDDADPAPFFQRFDKLISELLNYPVLATDALPDCMKHKDSTGKVKQRAFDDSVFKYFESLLSSHVEYEYKIVAHPDTKREDIIRLLEKPTALSKALRKSTDPRVNQLVIPVFIDENNTLIETAGLVKTIMCDRRNPMQESSLEVDDELGVWFVGAINKKSEHYRTQDLHPSLKPSVSRFEGISSSSQQHSYIEQTLRRCAEFLSERRFQSLKEQLVNIMLKIHQKSEELSKRSTDTGATFTHLVSQREFHKVDAIIRTVYKLLGDKVKNDGEKIGDKDILLVCSCLTAVYYVYVARIRGEAERTDMKNFMERLCRDGDIRDVYFPDEENSIVDAARKRMLAEVVTKEAFKLGSGIALTDTLKENIFLTLLACTSLDKNKLCLAIIGDSGMGKTLSSRIVERSLKGVNSDTEFCSSLPQTRFFYIQGATTTTSEQVSRVCERAQKDQERDKNGGKSIVSFDEASLPKSERLVHKSLHEPVDRKIISIIVLSNKPFDDEANQNRFLVVWNESLFQEEVQELTAGCLEYDTFSRDKDDVACIYRPVVTALTKSYFDLRNKGQQQIAGQRNTAAALQMRDYVYLLKYLAESSDGKIGQIFTPIDLQKAIEINYGTSAKETLPEVLTLFFSNMKLFHAHIDQSNWANPVPPKPRPIEAILQESYSRYKSGHRLRLRPRFKILIDPTETYCVANAAMSTIRNVVEEHNSTQRVIHITVSELEGDRKRSFEAKTLSKLRIAMERGDHVVIRNPERLLSYLFDVLNLNYTSFVNDKGEKIERAIVALGAETDLFDIHPLFLITFVFSATTIERLEGTNVPFLSRCEKYLLRIDYNEAVCKYISEFAQEWTGKHNIHMLHPQLTVASAITSTATPGSSTDYELDPEHVFRANCQLLSLISPQVFLRLYPKLARGPEYAKVYLDQHHFSLDELINSASAGTCTMACTTDTLALKRLTEESDHSNRSNKHHRTIIDVESSPSFEDLATKLNNLNKARNSDCIILVISSQRTRNADFMWALCNAIGELAGGTKDEERSRHPFVIISGAPCNVTAVFTTYWRYIFLDSCSSTKITRKLLQSYVTKVISKEFEDELDGNNASAASLMSASQTEEEVDDEEVDDTVVQEILRYFVATHQAVSYSHYSESGSPYDELSACADIPPIKEALLRSLADGLLPSSVSKLVHKCVKESTDQALKQPFMAILHQESKAAFLEGSRPLLRLIAGSALIDRANRIPYTGAKKSNENTLLASCIQAHRTYCASELPLEEGKPKIYITNHPESGAHRHPLSSWIVPVIWHRVFSFKPASTQEKGQQSRLDEVILEYSTAIPPEFNLQALPQNEKDQILLDVMQQCGFLPPTTRKLKYSEKSAPGREVNGYEKAVLMAVAGYSVASGTRKKPEEVSFIRDLLLAASTAVGSECGWLRQDLMTSVFLGFLQSSGIRVAGKESQLNIAKNIANSIRTSYTSSVDGAYVGLSYLFSFLFRTQSPVAKDTNALGGKGILAIVAMLTDLDRTLLSGSLKPEERKKLVENAPSADAISLEYLDKYARHCGMLSPSVSSLTWYLAGLLDRPKELSKKNSSLEDSIKPVLADLEYWVRNGSIIGAGNNPLQLRPFFWPIVFALIDIVFESAAPLSNKSSKDKFLANTVEACSALTSSLLPPDYNPTLKSVLAPQASPAGASDETSTFLKMYLLHAFTNRIKVVLSATYNSLGESMRKLNQQCEQQPAALVRVALEVATCSLIASESNQQTACMEIARLTVAPKRPFFYNAPASGKQNDPFAMYLLLAYYERAKTIDGAKELLKTGAAAPNKIELFREWSSKDQAANRNAIQFCVPASVREAEQFAEVKMIIAEGGSVAAYHPRVVLHALREEVYLSQLMNPDAANAKRQAYTAACQEISGRLHPLSKKVAEFLLRPVADTSAMMYANLGTPASGLIEGLTEATRSSYVVPALVTYIMIEVATRLRKEDEHPTNFWEMLMITPTFFKGQSTFGDLFGSNTLIHGFDCGAKFDEATGEKQQRCNSIPDNVGQYSLFALLYGGILAYFLLNPDKKSIRDSVEYIITSTLLNDIAAQKANVAKTLQPIHAAAFTCQQHLGFLEAKGYNAQTILLHLMSTFNASIQSPPPVKCLNFADAEKYHSIFATMVPKQSDIRNEAHSINQKLAEGDWERQVLSLFKTLPGLDAPDVPSIVSMSEEPSVTKDLLDEYAHALEVAQIAPKIARLYTALNEVSSKLSSETDKDPNAITVKRIKQVAGQTAPAIAAGIEAFNKLLTINGGQLSVECRDQLVPALSDDTSVFEYVSKDPLLLPGGDSKELVGYLVHAMEAIRRQIPSIEALEERTKINADVKKVIDNAFLAQSASLWSMYNASSSSSDGMRDAAYKILSKFCEDKCASTQDVRSLEVAIQNFFVLPAMQIQIERGAIFAHFNFPRPAAADTIGLKHLEAEVRSLSLITAEQRDTVKWPFDRDDLSEDDLVTKLKERILSDPSLCFAFLTTAKMILLEDTSGNGKTNRSRESLVDIPDWPVEIRTILAQIIPEVRSSASFGARNAVLTRAHLPGILSDLLVIEDHYLEAATQEIGRTAFLHPLPSDAADAFKSVLTDKKSVFGKRKVADRIDLVEQFSDVIAQACSVKKPADHVSLIFEEYGEPELTSLIPDMGQHPITLRCAAGLLATINRVKAEVYQPEHERKTHSRKYQWDMPEHLRIIEDVRSELSTSDGGDSRLDTLTSNFEDILNHDEDTIVFNTEVAQSAPEESYFRSPDDNDDDMPDYTDINNEDYIHPNAEEESFEHFEDEQESPPQYLWESAHAEGIAKVVESCFTSGRPRIVRSSATDTTVRVYQYINNPTLYIDTILEPGATRPSPPAAKHTSIVSLVPSHQVSGKFSVGTVVTTPSDKVAQVPTGYVAFEEGGRVLPTVAGYKGIPVIYSSPSSSAHTFQFRITGTDKDAKFPVCDDLSIGAATAIVEAKKKGTTYVPCTHESPIAPETVVTASGKVFFNEAPCPSPFIVIKSQHGKANFELLKSTDLISGTSVTAESVASISSNHKPETKPSFVQGTASLAAALITRRAVATAVGNTMYIFRTNVIDLCSGTVRMASLSSPRPTLSGTDLLAELIRTKALSADVDASTCTISNAVSCQVISVHDSISFEDRICIHLKDARAKETTVDIVLNDGGQDGQQSATFLLDARLSQVFAVMNPGNGVWWEGIKISDSVFENLRIGQLCSAKGTWMSPTISAILQGNNEEDEDSEAEDFFPDDDDNHEEEEADDFFATEEEEKEEGEELKLPQEEAAAGLHIDPCDYVSPSSTENSPQLQSKVAPNALPSSLRLTFSSSEQSTCPVRIHSPDSDEPFEFQLSDPVSDESIINLLCIARSMPRLLIVPAIVEADTPAQGVITVARRVATPQDGATHGSPQIDIYMSPAIQFDVTLFEHFQIYGGLTDKDSTSEPSAAEALSASALNLQVAFFSPANDKTDREATTARKLLASAEQHSETFTTSRDEDSEKNSKQFLQIVLSSIAATNHGLTLLGQAAPLVHCYPIGANVYNEDESDEPNNY